MDRFRVQFAQLHYLLLQAVDYGVLSPEEAEEHRKALDTLWQQVSVARFRGDGSLPPLLRVVNHAQVHLANFLN